MKLNDCGCGYIAQVTYKINEHDNFTVGCSVCDNRTPTYESLSEAVLLWNHIYCIALPTYVAEPAWKVNAFYPVLIPQSCDLGKPR
jgi:hypothetical protein